jgi:hypothetical protein
MNEQIPKETEPAQIPPGAAESIKEISKAMQDYAFANPALTYESHVEAILTGNFSKFFKINSTLLLQVILTISPSESKDRTPFWHCSMSIVSAETKTPKTVGLWTRRERSKVRALLPQFLGERGLIETQGFMQTKTALHCYRKLIGSDLANLRSNKKS